MSDKTAEALAEFLKELKRMKSGEVSSAELADAKEAQVRSIMSAAGSPDATVQRVSGSKSLGPYGIQISSKQLQPAKVAQVRSQLQSRFVTDYPALMAGLLITSLPVIGAYVIFQRHLVRGIIAGATK